MQADVSFGACRLILVAVSASICAGFLPGVAVWVDIFVEAGVFVSLCAEAEPGCGAQYIAVSLSMVSGKVASLLSALPVGLLFGRYGGRLSFYGAGLLVCGIVLLQVPLAGVRIGCEPWTSLVFPVAVMTACAGSMLNSVCLPSMVWHYPQKMVWIPALGQMSYSIAALVPILCRMLMRLTGSSLRAIMFAYATLVAAAGLTCGQMTPNMTECPEGSHTLGLQLVKRSGRVMDEVFSAHRVLLRDWRQVLFLGAMSLVMSRDTLMTTLSGFYGSRLLASDRVLAAMYSVMVAVVGTLTSLATMGSSTEQGGPFGARGCLWLGSALLVFSAIVAAVLVVLPLWSAQAITAGSVATTQCLLTVVLKRCRLFSVHSNAAVAEGLFAAYLVCPYLAFVCLGYAWVSCSMSSHDLGHAFRAFSLMALLGTTAFCIRRGVLHPPPVRLFAVPRSPSTSVPLPSDSEDDVEFTGESEAYALPPLADSGQAPLESERWFAEPDAGGGPGDVDPVSYLQWERWDGQELLQEVLEVPLTKSADLLRSTNRAHRDMCCVNHSPFPLFGYAFHSCHHEPFTSRNSNWLERGPRVVQDPALEAAEPLLRELERDDNGFMRL